MIRGYVEIPTTFTLKTKRKLYVRVSASIVRILLQMDKETYEPYVLPDGTMWALVLKAVYGTGDAAKLWYELVKDTLLKHAFVMNPYDRTAFNRIYKGSQLSVLAHIDDFLGSSKLDSALDFLYAILIDAFDSIKQETGNVLNYLGMVFNFQPTEYVAISAPNFINGTLAIHNVTEFADYPHGPDMRIIEDLPRLESSQAESFYSLAYKLLYLAKRYRFDMLPIAQFLTTRVQFSTSQDMIKARNALAYLNATKHLELRLNATKPITALCHIDASHAVNPDRKSQGGACIGLGRGHVHAATTSLKSNTQSAAESEFLTTGDNVTDAIFIRNYLTQQGYDVPPATIYQDNEAAIKLCENGLASSKRTRHIDIRYFFIQDRIKIGDIQIQYLSTKDMIADFLTKPLIGQQFYKLRDLLLGYTTL